MMAIPQATEAIIKRGVFCTLLRILLASASATDDEEEEEDREEESEEKVPGKTT